VQRRGRPGLASGQGVARPTGTPRGSDGGCAGKDGAMWFSPETADGGGAEKMVRCGSEALVAGEGIDEVLQLEEGTRQVRRGPKGVDEGSTGELTEGERNGGVDTRPRRDGKVG
jgi:hypothetical protein